MDYMGDDNDDTRTKREHSTINPAVTDDRNVVARISDDVDSEQESRHPTSNSAAILSEVSATTATTANTNTSANTNDPAIESLLQQILSAAVMPPTQQLSQQQQKQPLSSLSMSLPTIRRRAELLIANSSSTGKSQEQQVASASSTRRTNVPCFSRNAAASAAASTLASAAASPAPAATAAADVLAAAATTTAAEAAARALDSTQEHGQHPSTPLTSTQIVEKLHLLLLLQQQQQLTPAEAAACTINSTVTHGQHLSAQLFSRPIVEKLLFLLLQQQQQQQHFTPADAARTINLTITHGQHPWTQLSSTPITHGQHPSTQLSSTPIVERILVLLQQQELQRQLLALLSRVCDSNSQDGIAVDLVRRLMINGQATMEMRRPSASQEAAVAAQVAPPSASQDMDDVALERADRGTAGTAAPSLLPPAARTTAQCGDNGQDTESLMSTATSTPLATTTPMSACTTSGAAASTAVAPPVVEGHSGTDSTITISLAVPTDEGNLTEYQKSIRRELEFFVAQTDDTETNVRGRKKKVYLGQVGIRCRHCASLPLRIRTSGSVYYPAHLSGVYPAAQNMANSHLSMSCTVIPEDAKQRLRDLRERRDLGTFSGGKQYWVEASKKAGLYETPYGLWLRGSSWSPPETLAAADECEIVKKNTAGAKNVKTRDNA